MFQVNLNGKTVSILRVYVTVKKGTRIDHPSGASCYRGPHGTAVGTWEDGAFNLINFYREETPKS